MLLKNSRNLIIGSDRIPVVVVTRATPHDL
jgi:hypothetical protein